MPDDEFRYELDDGVLIVSPAPSTLHQLVVTRLAVIFSAACPAEFVVLAGVGVNISKFQHRVPDVAVVRAGSLESFFQDTAPALVVEVASPRTRLYDRNRKKDVYEGFGVPASWIVEHDRDRPELTVFELRSGAYEQTDSRHRRRGVPRGGSVPGDHRAVQARHGRLRSAGGLLPNRDMLVAFAGKRFPPPPAPTACAAVPIASHVG
jgi:Uma2 family endonuclease